MEKELRQRLLHIDRFYSEEEIWDVVRKFLQKMEDSNYTKG